MSALALAETGRQEEEQETEQRKLFEVKQYETRPTLISVSISGTIDLDLSQEADVTFFNSLEPGKLVTREATFFVAAAKTTYQRDKDGNVDAVPQVKSLVVDGLKIAD